MQCDKCGKNLPAGSQFCGFCGSHLVQKPQEALNGIKVKNDIKQSESSSPKRGLKRLVGIGLVIVSIFLLVFLVGVLLGHSKGEQNAYAILTDGKYELFQDTNKGTTIEIASSKSYDDTAELLTFSPDGKYVYYYSRYDEYTETGSLYRAEYAKLKRDSNKNDRYIELIAPNVRTGIEFLKNGSVIFQNEDDSLYCYNGEKVVLIAKSVTFYQLDQSNRMIYEAKSSNGARELYGINTDKLEEKNKLASGYDIICDRGDFDHISFIKKDDSNRTILYVVGFGKKAERIEDNVTVLAAKNGMIYFTKAEKSLSLYDYVEDTYQESDKNITEPDIENFVIPIYQYAEIDDDNPSEQNYEELYTSCTKSLYWFGTGGGWPFISTHSMEEALEIDFGENSEKIHAIVGEFVDKYKNLENEDGVILVTDEIKKELLKISQYAEKEDSKNNWLWLCREKKQVSTTHDYDAYYEAQDKYKEVEARNKKREALKSKDNAYPVLTLYCYEDGKKTAIHDDVLECEKFGGTVIFNTTDFVTEKLSIEEVKNTSDITQMFQIDYEDENYILCLDDAKTYQISEEAIETFTGLNSDSSIYIVNTDVFVNNNGELSVASAGDGLVKGATLIADESIILKFVDSTLYYVDNIYSNIYSDYGDLCIYKNGQTNRLAQDIRLDKITLYEDGMIFAHISYGSSYGYEVMMISPNGNTSLIEDDVTQYIRVAKDKLLYISDGDLYLVDGKKKRMIASDVDRVWSKNSMEEVKLL